jgi:hypothetical protein
MRVRIVGDKRKYNSGIRKQKPEYRGYRKDSFYLILHS